MKKLILITLLITTLSIEAFAQFTGKPSTPKDQGDYSYSTTINFTWTVGTANDPESPIAGYYIQVSENIPVTTGEVWEGDVGLVFEKYIYDCTDGKTYYARVRAKNSIGEYSNYSDDSNGITITVETLNVRSGPYSRVDLTHSATDYYLEANWYPIPNENTYWCSMSSTTPGIGNMADWYSIGQSTYVRKYGFSLQAGVTYYTSIKAIDLDNIEIMEGYTETQVSSTTLITGPSANPDWELDGDDGSFSYDLPFTFHLFGRPYDTAYICSNGFIVFDGQGFESFTSNTNSTDTMKNYTMIAPLWDDLDMRSGDVYISTSSVDNSVTVSWDGVIWDTTSTVKFEAVLYQSGNIKFNYGDGNKNITPTIGISKGIYGESSDDYLISTYNDSTDLETVQSLLIKPEYPTSAGVLLDLTPPTGQPSGINDGGMTYGSSDVTFYWSTGTVLDAESDIIGYKLEVSESSTTWSSAIDAFVPDSGGGGATREGTVYGLVNGKTYYARVSGMNGAGVFTSTGTNITDGIKVDTTKPTGELVMNVPGVYHSSTTVAFNWSIGTSSDPESGIDGYSFEIFTDSNFSVLYSSYYITGTTKTITGLTHASSYYYRITPKNGAGEYSATPETACVTIDTTAPLDPPLNLQPIYVEPDTGVIVYSSSVYVGFTWDPAVDAESGIADYRIYVFDYDTAGGVYDEDYLTGGATFYYISDATQGIRYDANVVAINGTGATSGFSGDASAVNIVKVDLSAPTGFPAPFQDYPIGSPASAGDWCSKTAIDYYWSIDESTDPTSNIAGYHVIVSSSNGFEGTNDISSADFYGYGKDTSSGAVTVELTAGVTYYARACAINGAGMYSVYSSTTDGIRVDITPPAGTPGIPYPDSYTNYFIGKTTITFSWTAGSVADGESGIKGYDIVVSTKSDLSVVFSSATVSVSSFVVTGCEHGQTFYAKVKARNGADLTDDDKVATFTNGVEVDLTGPSGVVDYVYPDEPPSKHIDIVDEFYVGTNTFKFTWFASGPSDAESGIYGYHLEVSTDANYWGSDIEFSGGISIGTLSKEITVSTSTGNGKTFFARVATLNNAGLYGEFSSTAAVTMDITPPLVPAVVRDGSVFPDKTTTLFDSKLEANWEAVVEESGLNGYDFSIGTAPGSANVYGWSGNYNNITSTDIVFTKNAFGAPGGLRWGDTTYYFNVRTQNYLDVVSTYVASSNGIRLVDQSAPVNAPSKPTCNSWSKSTAVTFNWQIGSAADTGSGIEGFWLQVSTGPGGHEKFDAYVGGVLTYAVPNCVDGKTYYARVKAMNYMGLYGVDYSTVSAGITVDLTVPSAPASVAIASFKRGSDGGYTLTISGTVEDGSQIRADSVEITDQNGRDVTVASVSALASGTTMYTNSLTINGTTLGGTITLENIPAYYPLATSVNITVYVYDAAGNKSAGCTAFSHAFGVSEAVFECWNNVYKKGESTMYPAVKYGLKDSGVVTIVIYNLLGDLVKTLVDNETKTAAQHTKEWDLTSDSSGNEVASGVYLVHIEAPGLNVTRKIVVVK